MKLILGAAEEVHPYHHRWIDETWARVDKYVGGDDVLKMDATALEFDDHSIEAIYASHLLEHFSYLQVPKILKHWFDKLQTGGWLHLNVPDIEWACQQVLSVVKQSTVFNTNDAIIGGVFYGSQAHEGEYHKSGYTKQILTRLLEEAGFTDIVVEPDFEAHEMGVLIADAYKP